ncbi:hypothetical protein [Desulfobacterium sp. N47]
MKFKLITIIVILISIPAYAGNNIKGNYIKQNRLLEEEIKLSRKADIYFVFNISEKVIYIKSRGINLKELGIQDSGRWGNSVSVNSYKVKEKSTFIKPGRETIKPGNDTKKDTFELEALELKDMPSRYTIVLFGGATVFIRPSSQGIITATANAFYSSIKFFTHPLSMVWNTLKGSPYTAFDIVLNENDARALYWSLSNNSAIIVCI